MDSITIKKASLSSGMGLSVIYTQKEKDGSITEIGSGIGDVAELQHHSRYEAPKLN